MDDQDADLIPAGGFNYDPADPAFSEHQHELIQMLLSMLQDVRKNEVSAMLMLSFYYDTAINRKLQVDPGKVSVFEVLGGLYSAAHSIQSRVAAHDSAQCQHCEDEKQADGGFKPDPIM